VHFPSRMYLRSIAAFLTIAIFGLAHLPLAQAEATQLKTQVPGYYRTMLGQFEITALYDGPIGLDSKLLTNASQTDIQQLLAAKFVGTSKMQTAVNGYLINTGSRLVLVDAGAGKLYGDALGNILQNMKAAGYDANQVDAVVITHMHGDHIGGLLDASGQPVFPKADIYVSKADNDFWLSQKNADAAPVDRQRHFKSSRNIAAPFIENGKWKTFAAGTELVPGVKAVATPGHTPGHTSFAVESQGQKLLILGDLVHNHAVQFARPDVAIEFDTDQKQAVATRLAVFKEMAQNRELVAGMHLPFPGIGHVGTNGAGAYTWIPVEFSPLKK